MRIAFFSYAALLACAGMAEAQECATNCDDDADCDGVRDDEDPCPTQCDHRECVNNDPDVEAPMECDVRNACPDSQQCTESGRCARHDPSCLGATWRYAGDGLCVAATDIDGVPNSCQNRSKTSRWNDPGYCRKFTHSVGFLGIFVTPYGLGYVQGESDDEITAGIEIYAAGRLGTYHYDRGNTITPLWNYYVAVFGDSYFDDDGHVGARLGLKYRIRSWPSPVHCLTDIVTRAGVSIQYIYGEPQLDGDRSHLPGVLGELEIFGALSVGAFVQFDVNHEADLGFGGVIRFDLSYLEELGIVR